MRKLGCKRCKLVYLNPQPNQAVLDYFYRIENRYFSPSYQRSPLFVRKLSSIGFQKKVNILSNFINLKNKLRLLDIGCSSGDFLYQLQKRFPFEVYGIDKDDKAIEFINENYKNIKAYQGTIFDVNLENNYFDIIIMSGYLEHEKKIAEALGKVNELLKPKGIIIIEAANIEDKLAQLDIDHWPYWVPPFHIIHFSPSTIQMVLSNANFKVLDIKFDITAPYILKYSQLLLYLLYRYNIRYDSHFLDYLIYQISRPIKPIEKKMGFFGKMIIIGQKN